MKEENIDIYQLDTVKIIKIYPQFAEVMFIFCNLCYIRANLRLMNTNE